MKFSQDFQENINEPWRQEYVSYEEIASDIKQRQLTWNAQDERCFETTLRLEADRVDLFVNRKQREIDSRLAYCERSLTQQNKTISLDSTHKLYESTDDTLIEIWMDLSDLSKFTRYNFMALQELIKKHNKYTSHTGQPAFINNSCLRVLDRQRFDATLVKTAALRDICKSNKRNYTKNSSDQTTANTLQENNQSNVEQATAKYWIHPDNITELKAILLFHLPLRTYNIDKQVEAVSSIYFDNSDHDIYQCRLQHDEGAEEIRFRWYGNIESKDVYIERKMHYAPRLNDPSVQDRLRLDADKVDDFIKGKYTADQYASDLKARKTPKDVIERSRYVAASIQKSIREKHLESAMRVFYNRTVFQIPTDKHLTVSLDTNLTFVREDNKERREYSWRRYDMDIDYPFDYIPESEVHRFPYAVLEVNLRNVPGQEPPQWLTRLLESRLVYEVPRFSKYLQGTAHFWNSRLPLLPWWLNQLNLDILNVNHPINNSTDLFRCKNLKPLIDGKYRLGYLESQLEHILTMKRSESQKKRLSLTRETSLHSMRLSRPTSMRFKRGLIQSNASNTHTISHQANNRNNPFDDPIWSQKTISFDGFNMVHRDSSVVAWSGKETPDSIGILAAQEFLHCSSTEQLVSHTQPRTISDTLDEKQPRPNDESHLNRYSAEKFLEDGKPYEVDYSKMEKKRLRKQKERDDEGAIIEPKVFFASERTFIHWLHFSATLLSAALTLLNFGDGINTIVGCVFFGISMIFALYSFSFYRWRAWRITNKPHLRFDDVYGPVFLCILLIGALTLNFVLRFNSPAANNNYLSSNNTQNQGDNNSS